MELVTKVKPNINSVDEVHPQLSNTTEASSVDGESWEWSVSGLLLVVWPACQIMPDNLSKNMQSSSNWAYSVVLVLGSGSSSARQPAPIWEGNKYGYSIITSTAKMLIM
jgi:hypothetical protein